MKEFKRTVPFRLERTGEVRVQLDGRLLPGFGPDDMMREVRAVVGPEPDIEVQLVGPAQPEIDLSQLELFASVLREADPGMRCRDPHIAGDRELGAAPERIAVQAGDDGDGQLR